MYVIVYTHTIPEHTYTSIHNYLGSKLDIYSFIVGFGYLALFVLFYLALFNEDILVTKFYLKMILKDCAVSFCLLLYSHFLQDAPNI